jgi:membrane-bound inhibitor of C-type lysozyme
LTEGLAQHLRMLRTVPLAVLLLAGCATLEEAGPSGIPYACADGKTARVTYQGGGYFPRGRARLVYAGREIDLAAVPPTYGLRYVSDGAGGAPILIWSARGEEAWLTELDAGADEERTLAHCTRVRG